MSIRTSIAREFRVAFSRRAQPAWFRILKWGVLVAVSTLLRRRPYFWAWILAAIGLSLTVHFTWRWKTKGWTRSWGGWDGVKSADGR